MANSNTGGGLSHWSRVSLETLPSPHLHILFTDLWRRTFILCLDNKKSESHQCYSISHPSKHQTRLTLVLSWKPVIQCHKGRSLNQQLLLYNVFTIIVMIRKKTRNSWWHLLEQDVFSVLLFSPNANIQSVSHKIYSTNFFLMVKFHYRSFTHNDKKRQMH